MIVGHGFLPILTHFDPFLHQVTLAGFGVHLRPGRQQHATDLHVAAARRRVQRGQVVAAVPPPGAAGPGPKEVAHRAHAAAQGRRHDVAASVNQEIPIKRNQPKATSGAYGAKIQPV